MRYIIFFKEKLERVGNGYSCGGAHFPDEVVEKFDEINNSLWVKDVFFESDDRDLLLNIRGWRIGIIKSKVKEIIKVN